MSTRSRFERFLTHNLNLPEFVLERENDLPDSEYKSELAKDYWAIWRAGSFDGRKSSIRTIEGLRIRFQKKSNEVDSLKQKLRMI